MDLSRLARSQADLPKIIDRLTARGIRVIGVQDGYDSDRKGHKLQAGLSGIIGEAFRDMVSERTHAALESRAHRGEKTGGKCYGYRDGEIVEAEAEIVRWIFKEYAAGNSPRWIAAELNRRGVPSPGSSWKRTQRRKKGWAPSAIHGDRARGSGILNNDLYVGQRTWNRLKWVKDPDTGKRRSTLRPESEWIVTEMPELRIVDDVTWRRVKARQEHAAAQVGHRVRQGLTRHRGQAPRYAFTGLLKCTECGGSLVMADDRFYCCSGYLNGRVCSNNVRVKRAVVEARLLEGIQAELLSDQAIADFRRRLMRAGKRPDPTARRRQELQAEVDRYADAIASGLMSPTVRTRLEAAEAELAALAGSQQVMDLVALIKALPRAVEVYRRLVENLGETIQLRPDQARESLRGLLGEIRVTPEPSRKNPGKRVLVARMGLNEKTLTATAGGPAYGSGSGGRI